MPIVFSETGFVSGQPEGFINQTTLRYTFKSLLLMIDKGLWVCREFFDYTKKALSINA